jgi:hypothetical protein
MILHTATVAGFARIRLRLLRSWSLSLLSLPLVSVTVVLGRLLVALIVVSAGVSSVAVVASVATTLFGIAIAQPELVH